MKKLPDATIRGVLDAVPDATVIVDESGQIVFASRQVELVFGHKPDELIGTPVEELIPRRYRASHPAHRDTYFADPRPRPMGSALKLFGVRRDGGEFPVEISLSPVHTDDGTLIASAIRDVSDRVALSEHRFRAIFQQKHQLSGIVDLDGTLLDANERSLSFSGLEREDVIGKLFWETPWWRHDSALQAQIQSAVERAGSGETVSFEAGHPRPDGTMASVDFSIRPVRNECGDVLFLVAESHDVTERKLAEEQKAGLHQILEQSLNEVYIFHAETLRFIHANQGARSNIGYRLDELRELTPADIKPEFTSEQYDELIEPLRSNERQKLGFETLHRRRDGTTYPVEVHLQRAYFESMPVFAAIILDTTERKEAERALRESHELLGQRVAERTTALASQKEFSDKLVSTLQGIVVLLDRKVCISLCNAYFENLTGYAADELIGRNWIDTFIPDVERDEIRDYFDVVMRDGMNDGYVNPIVLKNGGERLIQWHSITVEGSDGENVGLLCTGYDVTEQVANVSALEASKKEAESATATKSRFLAAASHDLRQPLQSLGLYLSVMQRRLDEQSDQPALHEISAKMRQSLDTMSELLDALLDISKLDGGSIAPNRRDIRIQELMDRIVTDNIQQAEEKGLRLDCSGDDCVVYSDPALLERVIENFVTNAIRYTESGRVAINCQRHNNVVRIAVSDTGVGIARDDLDKVFEEYYQLENPVRDRRKGLGLGLAIVRHIARLLDHPVVVTSTLGEGSVFAVDVPLGVHNVEHVETGIPQEITSREGREPVVLLVDDDPAIVDATTMLLNVSGFIVHSAMCGDDALAHLANGVDPDVVISDFRLPGYDGVELIHRIRDVTSEKLPTVLITGDTSGYEIEKAHLEHCTVLHKPVDTDQLISIIENIAAEGTDSEPV